MLKRIPDFLDADLLWVLAAMGHGDTLVLADRNFPAHAIAARTVSGRLVQLAGIDAAVAARGILELLPLDAFVDAPLSWMDPVDAPGTVLPVHAEVLAACCAAEGRDIGHAAIERHAFYAAAAGAFAVVQTTESRPYGCFLLKKGVVFDAPVRR